MRGTLAVALIALSLAASGCAIRYADAMDEWVGAPREEWVEAWGYPQFTNDIVTPDDSTVVLTYRSPHCAMSVTFIDGVLVSWIANGFNCPKVVGRRRRGGR